MAVRIKFDNTHNVIQPTFVLATRAGHKLGTIPAVGISVSDSFNSRFELEFQVYHHVNGEMYQLWDKITDFKLVWCKEWDVWFEMYVTVQDDNNMVKTVTCVSLGEAELSQIDLYNIEINTENDIARDDYVPTVLFDPDNRASSLLSRIMEKAPHYSVNHVDASIAKIQRTFTFNGQSLYDAFQKIAEEIDCIFVIGSGSSEDGSIERSISVYDLESYCLECGERNHFSRVCPKCGSKNILSGYGEDTSIFISTENLADNITLKTDTASVKNCFRMEAGDDLMTAAIMNCNPNGSQYIWYISDSIKGDMSDELRKQLEEYDRTYNYYQKEHRFTFNKDILTAYNKLVTKYRSYNKELPDIPESIIGYPELMNVYYNTIDLFLFLRDGLMPSHELQNTTAVLQAAHLTSAALSPVAVQSLSKCSSSTASSAVLAMAKTIIDKRYQVKVKNGTLEGSVWVGNFTVTNYSDETDMADSDMVRIAINEDDETFTRQRVDKILKNAADDNEADDIVSVFKLELEPFREEIKKYCLTSLQMFCDAGQSCLDILIEQGIADKRTWADKNPNLYTSLYLPYHNKLAALQNEIKTRESEIAVIAGIYDSDGGLSAHGAQTIIEAEKAKVQDALNMEKFLGKDLWLELISYRREDTYSNENYISDGLDNRELFSRALEFIEVAQKEIYKSATLQHSLSATLKNLLVMKEFEPIVDSFSVGNWIRVKVNNDVYRLRLISYSVDFDDLDNMSIEFSDVKKFSNGVSDSEDIIKQAASMASSYDTVTRQANQGKKSDQKLKDWITNGLALTKMKIIDDADNQNIIWDSHGLLFREYLPITDDYSDKQLKIINKGLYITDDNWLTSKAGIGDFTFWNPASQQIEESYGVIADTLVGNLILSKKVGIYNTQNSITLDENGMIITADKTDNNSNQVVFTIQRKETGADGNPYSTSLMHIDSEGNLILNGSVRINSASQSMATLDGLANAAETASSNANAAQSAAATANERATYHYGTCATAANVSAKAVVLSGFKLYTGATISVYFTYANTAANPTLNVNNTGAKNIRVNNANMAAAYYWSAANTVTFIYNGTYWVMSDSSANTNIANWCYNSDTTYINGGKIYAGTVTAKQINVADLFAQDITATGSITSPILKSADYAYSSGRFTTSGMIVDLKNKVIRTPNLYLEGGATPDKATAALWVECNNYRTIVTPSGIRQYGEGYISQMESNVVHIFDSLEETYSTGMAHDRIWQHIYNGAKHNYVDITTGAITLENWKSTSDYQIASITGGRASLSTSDNSVSTVVVGNSIRAVALTAGAAGDIGLWDNTNQKWILYSNTSQNVTVAHPLSVTGAISATGGLAASSITATSGSVVSAANVYAGTPSDTVTRSVYARNKLRSVRLLANASGVAGLYDDTNNIFILQSSTAKAIQIGESAQTSSILLRHTNGYASFAGNGMELYGGTPYIDFHFGGSTADYTSRIIEEASGALTASGVFNAKSHLGFGYNSGKAEYAVRTLWADGATHNALTRAADGLTLYIGWAGNTTYLTRTVLRARNIEFNTPGQILPTNDGQNYLGNGSRRFKQIFAVNGAIATSDKNEKRDIEYDLTKMDTVFDALKPCSFYRVNGDRLHFGLIAQEVEQALASNGMNIDEIGLVCRDHIYKDGENGEKIYLYNADGTPQYRYGLRYEELHGLEIQQIQYLKKLIQELERKILEMKEEISC